MNKKLLGLGVALATGTVILTSSASAFWGGNMTAERFEEFKTMVSQSTDFGSFQEMMKSQRGEMRANRQFMRENLTHSVENISNGVIRTITSDDAGTVEKLHTREARPSRNEDVTRTIEKLENGLKITIISDDADLVEKIQSRGEHPQMGRQGRRGQGRNGQQGQGRRNGGQGQGRTW